MVTVDLNSSYNTLTYNAQSQLSVKPLPFIAQNCGKAFPFFNVDEKCDKYCIPYKAEDEFIFQINTSFNLTYIGWNVIAYDKAGNQIFNSLLTTAGIGGVTSAPTGDDIFWRKTVEGGQELNFFKINESDLSGELGHFEIKFEDRGLFGTDPPLLLAEYKTPCYEKATCNTLEIQSEYDNTDCDGSYYANVVPTQWTPSAGFAVEPIYSNKFRIKGGVEKQSYDFEERQLDSFGEVTNFIKRDVYLLKTIIPEYVADHLINVLSGKKLTINGKSYNYEDGFEKNNDENSLWLVETELFTKCNKSNLC